MTRRAALLVALGVVILGWWRGPGCSARLAGHFAAGLERYDYLESLHFGASGSGEMVWGWDQLVRLEVPFRHRTVGRDQVEIRYQDRSAPPRTIGFRLRRGRFHFERPLPARGCVELIDCLTRARFEESPWPPEGPTTRDYYADCRSEIRCNRD